MYEGLWGFLQNGASMAPERHGDAALNFRVAHGLAPRVFLGGCFSVYAVDTVLLPLCAGARPRQCRQGGGYCCHGERQVASSQLPAVTEVEIFIICLLPLILWKEQAGLPHFGARKYFFFPVTTETLIEFCLETFLQLFLSKCNYWSWWEFQCWLN